MDHNKNYGQLVKVELVAGYPVAVCVSNKTPEKQGNSIVTQLVKSYEERKKSFKKCADLIAKARYN